MTNTKNNKNTKTKKTTKKSPAIKKDINVERNQNIKNIKKLVKKLKFNVQEVDMGKHGVMIQCQDKTGHQICGEEFEIRIDLKNVTFISIKSLFCPKKVFELATSFSEAGIKMNSIAIIHTSRNNEIVGGGTACAERKHLLMFIHNLINSKDEFDEEMLQALPSEKMATC